VDHVVDHQVVVLDLFVQHGDLETFWQKGERVKLTKKTANHFL
jgi:hypothetical protein